MFRDAYRRFLEAEIAPRMEGWREAGIVDREASLIGAWAPGGLGLRFPPGTGLQVDPGSVVVLEMHYNTGVGRQGPDQSAVLLQTEASVDRRAAIVPLALALN